jgi:MFS family permease
MQSRYHWHYFSQNLGQEVKELYWSTALNALALSLVFIFEPVYLFKLGYTISQILWFYVQVYSWYAILIFIGARFSGRFGLKHSIFVSNIFYVCYWILLFLIKDYSVLFFAAPIFFALQKSFYWQAFNADISISSQRKQRGRETGVLLSLIEVAFIIGPFFGGWISEKLGFLVLFITSSCLMISSAYPLFKSSEMYSRHHFHFRNFWKILKAQKRNFFSYFGYAEDLMVMSLWPVYLFIVVPDFSNLGVFSMFATLVATVIMLIVGRVSDYSDKPKLLKRYSFFYALTWVFRFLAKGLPLAFIFDSLTKIGKDAVHVPIAAVTFDNGAEDGPDYAIAYGVFYEWSLSIGKIFTALLGILLMNLFNDIYLVFILTGILTMFYGFLTPMRKINK